MQSSIAIIGAGIIGSAIAYELSRRGISGIHVFDADIEGELSSTERNAGGVRHLWQQPINIELSRASIEFFESIKKDIGFVQSGYLWLYSKDQQAQAKQQLRQARSLRTPYEELSISELKNRYPFIDKTDDLALALFGPKDGLINSNALKNYYRTHAKKSGVHFHDRHWFESLKEEDEVIATFSVLDSALSAAELLQSPTKTGHTLTTHRFSKVILALGPWMSYGLTGLVKDPMVVPIRRQIVTFKAEGFDMTPYGMVVDTSRVYFHPEGGNILAGLVLKDEKPGYHFGLDSDFFESHIWPSLYERSSKFEKLKALTGWGGLYSYTPDTSGILGKLPNARNVFECHSFTGRGVMQSYGAAVALSDLVTFDRFDKIDASQLHRSRFERKQFLGEGLHI